MPTNAKTIHLPGALSSSQTQIASPTNSSFPNDKIQKAGHNANKQNSRINTKNKVCNRRAQKASAKVEHSLVTSAPAVVVRISQPSRDERKLSGLQAKLAALKEKLAKK